MAHFAIIRKSDNTVVQVIRVDNSKLLDENKIEQEKLGIDFLNNFFPKHIPEVGPTEDYYFKQTIYTVNGETEKRYNFAGIGHTFDESSDAFIAQEPQEAPKVDTSEMSSEQISKLVSVEKKGSWTLNEEKKWVFTELTVK